MLLAALLLPSLLLTGLQPAACADADSCRDAALEAAAREDFEAFHDLAWRAVQRGRRHDPDLMYLLARAQSLSGRPGDALVMLRRLAGMGVATDARENPDFQRVRALAAWPALEAAIAAAGEAPVATAGKAGAGAATAADTPAEPEAPAAPPAASAAPGTPGADPPPPRREPDAPPAAARAAVPAAAEARLPGEAALRLTGRALEPVGLAYDDASRRFVLADSQAGKLIVADDVFNQVTDLTSAASAGFGALTAIAIDSRRGDLWVASAGADGAAGLHRLQLVSGRTLSRLDLPDELRPARFGDAAVTGAGAILLLDVLGTRLLSVAPAAGRFGRGMPLGVAEPASLAAAGDRAYVAHAGGVAIIDLASGRVTGLNAADGVALQGLQRIRWHRGSLVALQADTPRGRGRLVRVRLASRGNAATAVEPLDDETAIAGSPLTVSRDAAYYLSAADGDFVLRRVPLQ